MKRKVPWIIAGVVVLIATLMVWWLIWSSTVSAAALPDGTTIRLEHLTYGKEHIFVIGNPVFNSLQKLLPARWQTALPASGKMSFPTATDEWVGWLTRRDLNGNYSPAWARLDAVDEHGCIFYQDHSQWMVAGKDLRNVAEALLIPRFVGHQKKFKLRFFDAQDKLVAEMLVRNPESKPVPFPEGNPQTLPLTTNVGNLAVSLTGLSYAPRPHADSFRPIFTFKENGQSTSNWVTQFNFWSDLLGNRDRSWIGFCREEPAWKLRGIFFPSFTAPFASNEVWTVPEVSIPAEGPIKNSFASNTLQGVTVQFLGVFGAGFITFSNGMPDAVRPLLPQDFDGIAQDNSQGNRRGSVTFDRVHVMLRVTGLKHYQRLSVRLIDSQGKKYDTFQNGGVFGSEFYMPWEQPPDHLTNLTVEMVIQKGREAEFVIPPPVIPKK